MQLVETGKVDLDAPVQRYLPWFRVADADASARITVRHLLNQTSGFPTFQANAGMIGGDMDEQALERTVRSFASMSLSGIDVPVLQFQLHDARHAGAGRFG